MSPARRLVRWLFGVCPPPDPEWITLSGRDGYPVCRIGWLGKTAYGFDGFGLALWDNSQKRWREVVSRDRPSDEPGCRM